MFDYVRQNDNEKLVFGREYSRIILNTEKKFAKYADESDELIADFVKNAGFLKNCSTELRENFLCFLVECDGLAQKTEGNLSVYHQKDKNTILATIVCDRLDFEQNEIQCLFKLCALSNKMSFFTNFLGDKDFCGATADFYFQLSEDSFTLANLINHINHTRKP